jgi:hypothetical protein
MPRKEQLKEQFADGRLPPAHPRSFTGYNLVQDKGARRASDASSAQPVVLSQTQTPLTADRTVTVL